MDGELRLHLAEEGSDAERLAMVTGYLRGELLELDVEGVTALPSGEPPPGARTFGVDTVGAVLIALGQSADGLRSVVAVIRNWLRRGERSAARSGWNSTVTSWNCRRRARLIGNGPGNCSAVGFAFNQLIRAALSCRIWAGSEGTT